MHQSIYVLVDSKTGNTKIGCSRVPKERRRTIAKKMGRDIVLAYERVTETDAFRVERAIHLSLQKHRVAREWFAVSAERAIGAVNRQFRDRMKTTVTQSDQSQYRELDP